MADIEWVAADGTVYGLDAISGANPLSSMQHLSGKRGRLMPPVRARYEPIAASPGQRLTDLQLDAREVALPVAIVAPSASSVRAEARLWAARFNPELGDGALRVNDLAPAREMVCRYTGGMEGAEGWDDLGRYTLRMVLVFRAPSPYWRALADSSQVFSFTASGAVWFPIFPLRLNTGATLNAGTVTNNGDVNTWPVFTCSGPFTSITLRNNTTGDALTVNATAEAGESVVIDTNPLTRSVTKNGTNLYSLVASPPEWWPLVPGTNDVSIEGAGFTGTPSVTVSWRELYLTV